MEAKNVVGIGLLTLVLGLGIGYFAGASATASKMPAATHQMQSGSGDGIQRAMDGMTTGLQGKTGDELDRAFLEGMIIHHEGAVAMARTLLAGTKRPELIKLGNDIITAQTGEIQMMREWRRDWFEE